MAEPLRVACLQLNNGRDAAAVIPGVVEMIHAAAPEADLIALPENADRLEPDLDLLKDRATTEEESPALAAYRQAARDTGRRLLIGSLVVARGDGQLANRSFLVSDTGEVTARYDKIHMFDVSLPNGEDYRESERCTPGDAAVVADTPWGGLGMTVCYDLRFPHLHRALAKNGAKLLSSPAAFTQRTGEAHWHVLLRARAIETACFVIAPAQCGIHAEGRRTFGHSLIVDPWGEVLAEGGTTPGIVTAALDLSKVDAARRMIPALTHDRDFSV